MENTQTIGGMMTQITELLTEVEIELETAQRKFSNFASPHEGYAVILEELDELWELIKRNHGRADDAHQEAIQIAAMAMRYIIDLNDE